MSNDVKQMKPWLGHFTFSWGPSPFCQGSLGAVTAQSVGKQTNNPHKLCIHQFLELVLPNDLEKKNVLWHVNIIFIIKVLYMDSVHIGANPAKF